MMITAVVATALSVVREKERNTMEQVRMAPIGTFAYIAGKTVPYFFLSLVSALLIVLASMALFDLPVRGSWGTLLLAVSLFIVGALGTGLLVSTVADSQQMAFQVALVVAFLPHLDALGVHLPDLIDAGAGSGGDLRGSGALLPGRAARRPAQGDGTRGILAGACGAGRVRDGDTRSGGRSSVEGVGLTRRR